MSNMQKRQQADTKYSLCTADRETLSTNRLYECAKCRRSVQIHILREVLQLNSTTHVVAGIEYGVTNILQVSQKFSTNAERRNFALSITVSFGIDACEYLLTKISTKRALLDIASATISGTVSGDIGYSKNNTFNETMCSYYGDTPLVTPPLTLEQFANATGRIAKVLGGRGEGHQQCAGCQ